MIDIDPSEQAACIENPLLEKAGIKEWQLLFLLAAMQFTQILDFVIMMPLGPTFLRVFKILPSQFGLLVSAYTFAAAIFGFVSASYMDRFDRKKSLLFLYFGFIVGTLFCALAPNHFLFLIARSVAGAFAGILLGAIFAIVGDKIPEHRRGRATGIIMSSFALAAVVGVPFGLFLANRFSWRAPFIFLAGICTLIFTLGTLWLPNISEHLIKRTKRKSPLAEVFGLISEENHWKAFALTFSMMLAQFFLVPYIATYMVLNVGIPEKELFYIYLVGGSFTFFGSQITGKLADRFGKKKIFQIAALISLIPVYLITHIGRVGLPLAIATTTFFMITNSARFVPAMAMITGSVKPQRRGGFMSINASLQQLAAGIASLAAGLILVQNSNDKTLMHFGEVGFLAMAIILVSIYVGAKLKTVA